MKSICAVIAVISFTGIGCAPRYRGDGKTSVNAKMAADAKAAKADWAAALTFEGECDKGLASPEAYTACLEEQNKVMAETMRRKQASAPAPAPPPVAAPLPPSAGPVPVAPVVPPALPPVAAALPPPPTPTTLASGTVTFVPVATGYYCSVGKNIMLLVRNESDLLLEVRGRVVPLNCDLGNHWVPARVIRRNGVVDDTWVIPGHTTAKMVFLPMNGGIGNVDVQFEAFLNLGPQAPALATGHFDRTFLVPSRDGEPNWQGASDSKFARYQ